MDEAQRRDFARRLPSRPLTIEEIEDLQDGLEKDVVTAAAEDDPEAIMVFVIGHDDGTEGYGFDEEAERWLLDVDLEGVET